jgi:hypothetical protein
MRPSVYVLILAMATVVPVSADPLFYEFTYTATSGQIESFDFSFPSSAFITSAGESPTFAPFTIGNGVNSWTFTQDLTGFSPRTTGIICFGTAGALLSIGCTGSFHPPDGELFISFIDGLPSTTGTFISNFGGAFYTDSNHQDTISLGTGTLQLTVSDVPESSTIVLLGTVICAVILVRMAFLATLRQRLKQFFQAKSN